MSDVALEQVSKSYDGKTMAISDINLLVPDKAFVVLVGPSGCGKSTILRMIAGLEELTQGHLSINGKDQDQVAPGDRPVAMVFQDYALYPHMTVYENLAFGLKMKKLEKRAIAHRVHQAVHMLGLQDYVDRRPGALSGGQRQRVAMGRAVVKNAALYLFDEPLSNLDATFRHKMRGEIRRYHDQNQVTTIYVTHDQHEAMTLADILVVMDQGSIQQVGPPMEVYHRPCNRFVASFIGHPLMNFFEGEMVTSPELSLRTDHFLMPLGPWLVPDQVHGKPLTMGLRAGDIRLAASSDPDQTMTARVELVEWLGRRAHITASLCGQLICFEAESEPFPALGEEVRLWFDTSQAHFFDFGGQRINAQQTSRSAKVSWHYPQPRQRIS